MPHCGAGMLLRAQQILADAHIEADGMVDQTEAVAHVAHPSSGLHRSPARTPRDNGQGPKSMRGGKKKHKATEPSGHRPTTSPTGHRWTGHADGTLPDGTPPDGTSPTQPAHGKCAPIPADDAINPPGMGDHTALGAKRTDVPRVQKPSKCLSRHPDGRRRGIRWWGWRFDVGARVWFGAAHSWARWAGVVREHLRRR